MDDGEKKALKDITQFGRHVIHVLEDNEHPCFTYSIGIEQSTGQPELIVAGLKRDLAHYIVNEYNRRVRAGNRFSPGDRADGFIEGFQVEFRPVDKSHYRDYFGWAFWLYKGDTFEVLQLVWPTTSGIWPWDSSASDWYKYVQPVLDRPAP